MLRVAELMRHAVAQLLARGQVSDPILDAHTIIFCVSSLFS